MGNIPRKERMIMCPSGSLRTFHRRATCCIVLLMLCQLSFGQSDERPRIPRDYRDARAGETSDLGKENLERVAASSIQIREVLLKDAGLLVEMKRWIAKEATDNGQVVEDSNLSDKAIFDRLDRDVAFRSVATRLLQRYGYLLPVPNPDSTFAKEQDLVLKERARRLVQIEAQEDSESLRPGRSDQDLDRTRGCNSEQEADCAKGSSRSTQSNRSAQSEPQTPGTSPDLQPDMPPSISPTRTLQTDFSTGGDGGRDHSPSTEIELASSSIKSSTENPFISDASDSFVLGGTIESRVAPTIASGDTALVRGATTGSDTPTQFTRSNWKRPTTRQLEADATPVQMVRPANPFADIPSLYDMYVQASAWQHPAERFGLDAFRNGVNHPDAVPMDLPVGPDYVVGTGDSLAIDLWGGISQRLVRLVDREGRVALPETGPLLVSGKNLGEVQLEVQRALRTQFENVSADVSLSRLRTVRVYVVGDVAEPGAYDISSLSTPLNALFTAGGVTSRGSLRALRHSRGNQAVEQVDAYDLLLHGVRSDLKRLENGDTLLVPPMGPQVTVEGMVRRPAVYELLNETSLAEVL